MLSTTSGEKPHLEMFEKDYSVLLFAVAQHPIETQVVSMPHHKGNEFAVTLCQQKSTILLLVKWGPYKHVLRSAAV